MGVLDMGLSEKVGEHFDQLREDVVVLIDTETREQFLRECFYWARRDLLPELFLVGMVAYMVVAIKQAVNTLDFFGGQCYRLFGLLTGTEMKQPRRRSREARRLTRVLEETPTGTLTRTEKIIPEDAEAAGKAGLLVVGEVSVITEPEEGVNVFTTQEPRNDLIEFFQNLKGVVVFLNEDEVKKLTPSEEIVGSFWFRKVLGRRNGTCLMVVGSRVNLFGKSDICKERGLNVFFCSPGEEEVIRTFLRGDFERVEQEAKQRVDEGRVYRIIAPMQTGFLKKPS